MKYLMKISRDFFSSFIGFLKHGANGLRDRTPGLNKNQDKNMLTWQTSDTLFQ